MTIIYRATQVPRAEVLNETPTWHAAAACEAIGVVGYGTGNTEDEAKSNAYNDLRAGLGKLGRALDDFTNR